MARTVLRAWGVTRTEDFGEIVFNLVESGQLGKTDDDRREHFAGVFDFAEAFDHPFLPSASRSARQPEEKIRERAEGSRRGSESRA